ncbi:MAG: sulfide/dihydroorotate dehydrogenase-like FAD/NAD-binding protein [Bacillota bacterium]|nr:sulfide/dihydroorotate dehydrogenase-like FAD/NAD-binding protein [Bacillota bacterium]
MFPIIARREIAPGIHSLWVKADRVASKARPGHFVILRLHERGERIPLTVVGTEPEKGLVWLIFQEVGKSTAELAGYSPGDALLDVVGPLGQAEPAGKVGTVLCVGGGVGTAPVLPRAREFKAAGNRVIGIVGARNRDLLILGREMEETCDRVYFCTDDGSFGHHGLVTDLIPLAQAEHGPVDRVLAIGPVPMMRAAVAKCGELGLPVTVSLNALMVDGTGMCGACRVTVGGVTRFTCVDGPEFDGAQVDFGELSARLRQYAAEERLAAERFAARRKGGECQCRGA